MEWVGEDATTPEQSQPVETRRRSLRLAARISPQSQQKLPRAMAAKRAVASKDPDEAAKRVGAPYVAVASGTLEAGYTGFDWVCLSDGCFELVVGCAADAPAAAEPASFTIWFGRAEEGNVLFSTLRWRRRRLRLSRLAKLIWCPVVELETGKNRSTGSLKS